MVYLRFRFDSLQNYSFGFSDRTSPDQFGDFEVELSMSNAMTELRVNNDGTYDTLTPLSPNTWYNCWILVDNVNDQTQVWLNDRPLDGAVSMDQLDADGLTTFVFRGGSALDLPTFYIKTGGGSGPSGPLYIDDLYIENTNQLNLTNPLVRPGVGYCFGDAGVGTPCPCGNDNDGSVPGAGCANGVFTSGANLWGSGVASVSEDSLVLTTTGLEPNNTGLYFQADNRVNGGDGNVFGDGLRCAGGALVRLQIRTASASGASRTTIPLGARGGVSAGDTKRYQCWYRTIVNPPCGLGVNDFNLSNGYEVVWAP